MNPGTTLWVCRPADDPGLDWETEQGLPTVHVSAGGEDGTWPDVQPGVFDAAGGHRGHRIVVEFHLTKATSAELSLAFSVDRGPCADLEIVLDDAHRGVLHPDVVRADRSVSAEPGPVAGLVELGVLLPAAWLFPGRHTLSITTVLDQASAVGERDEVTHDVLYRPDEGLPPARAHYGRWFGSYLQWSRAALTVTPAPPAPQPVPSADVVLRPTPLFLHTDGQEVELVDCDVSWPAGTTPPDDITLDWPNTQVRVPAVPAGRDFGMFRWRFPAPQLDGPTTVIVSHSGRRQPQHLTPCRRWTLHLIPHVHLDLGFTDTQGKVLELHCRNIDRALDLMETDPDFRFCVDGSFVADQYERTRPPDRVRRMRAAVADGRLGVNTFHSNFLTGLLSLDELYRSTDYARSLPRSSRTGLRYANLTDVPTYCRTIASVLAELGIGGFVGMANHHRAATDTSDELHLMSPVRWQGPDGREVLAHFADHYSQLRFIAADPQAVAGAANGLSRYLARYERPDYLPTDLAVIGTHADNEDLADGDTDLVGRWNQAFAWPRFRLSTFDEYLAAVAPLASRLPLWHGETGSFWEDGVGSAAQLFATYRRTQQRLRAVETLGALVSAHDPIVRTNRAELDRAWADLSVAAEHTLTWARSTSHPHASAVADQLGWKSRYVEDAHRVSIDEMRRHLAQLADLLDLPGPGMLAYNPHAWTADLDGEVELADGIDLSDADGVVPLDVISSCAGLRRCRITLNQMPPHSWRFLPMSLGRTTVPGGERSTDTSTASKPEDGPAAATAVREPITSAGWLVDLDPASELPRRLLHRATGRELLDPHADVGLGQLVRTGETLFSPAQAEQLARPAAHHAHRRASTFAIGDFRPVADREPSRLIVESPTVRFAGRQDTHDGMRLRWCGDGAGVTGLVMELLLRDRSPVCDLRVSFDKQPCLDAEAVYVSFPFAGVSPVLRYDRPLGWVRPGTDHGSGAGNEWTAATHTVSVDCTEGEIRWTPLDTPLFTSGDVVRGDWPTGYRSGTGHVYAYAMNNYWPCNTPAWQEGPVTFSYRFAPAPRFDPAESTRFGRTARLGAQVVEILPLDRYRADSQPEYRTGELALASDDGLDLHLTQTAGDQVSRLRVVNINPEPIETTVTVPPHLHLPGTPANSGAVHVAVDGFGTTEVTLVRRPSGPESLPTPLQTH